MKRLFLIFGLAATIIGCASKSEQDLTQYVDPLIGTAHCRWFHFAPGAMPFGMAKPGPTTNAHLGSKSGWEASGFDYRDKSIEGFALFHEFQIGGVVLMPTVGELKTVPGAVDSQGEGYRSAFDRKDEVVTAGYYSVLLKDYNAKAEVTATDRVSMLRFTYPQSEKSNLLFDIGNRQGESGEVLDAFVELTAQGRVEGWVKTYPSYVRKYQEGATVTMYFSAVLDTQPDAYGAFNGSAVTAGEKQAKGKGAGLYLTYNTSADQKITINVGQSYTSIENARLNLATEAKDLTFDKAKELSSKRWNEMLGRVVVEGDSHDDKVKFYTGLYHAILGRGLANDVNGDYVKFNGEVGKLPLVDGKPRFNMYNTDAMWGAQWNLNQLWILAYPEYTSEFIDSQIQIYKDSGWLADGIAASKYVSGVGTNLVPALMTAAYQCGIRDFDVEAGYQASLKNEICGKDRPFGAGKADTELFVKHGFVPHQDQGDEGKDEMFLFSASHTMEYSYSSWAVAQWAEALGKKSDYDMLMNLSKGWERLFDTTSLFIAPRLANGEIIQNFNPMQVWRGFQEGNAWQYTFYVPHDVKGLVDKVGKERFAKRLDSIFVVSRELIFSGGQTTDAFAGLETLYNHGNQPCLHISWMFVDAEKPELTQLWVRRILNEFYGRDGIHGYGYGQDEDQGQLGAWYVLSSLGMFDVAGLTSSEPQFSLGAPLFKKVTIKTSPKYYSGKDFVIESKGNNSSENLVKGYMLNGKRLEGYKLSFQDVVKGGKLEVEFK